MLRSTTAAEIVVWMAALSDMTSVAQRSPDALSAAERSETDRLPPGRAREAFPARRMLRRALVAAHLGCGLAEVDIETRCERCGNPRHGRPTIAARSGELHLSTASAGDLLAVAVAPFPVGVDVERRDRFDARTAADVDLATGGAWTTVSQALGPGVSPAHVWTALESLGKGLGSGIVAPVPEIGEALGTWFFTWWEPEVDSVGCVAAGRRIKAMSTFTVPGGEP